MKTSREWMEQFSRSGPFDLVKDCDTAMRLIQDIQEDAVAADRETVNGRCGACKWNCGGRCDNTHIHEDDYRMPDMEADDLMYSYYEGGVFHVGPLFGCVHFAPKEGGAA